MGRALLTVLFFSAFISLELSAAELKADHLKITFETHNDGQKASKQKELSWKRACPALGETLIVGQGPWGSGVFGSFSCFFGKKKLVGDGNQSLWLLTVTEGEEEVSYVLTYQDIEQSRVTMPAVERGLDFLRDGEFSDNIAYGILDGLPMGLQVSKLRVSGNPPMFAGRHWRAGKAMDFKFRVPPPPEEIVLYKLAWDSTSKHWQSEVVGTAKMAKIIPPTEVKQKKRKMLRGGQVFYQVTPEIVMALNQGPLWGQNVEGPGARSAEIKADLVKNTALLNSAAESGYLQEYLQGKAGILDQILRTAASGYIGMRYGLQVLPSEGSLGQLLGKTGIFSLLLEVRGGPVKGLRYYYDNLAEQKLATEGPNGQKFETKIGFSRHVLGYSFGFDPGLFVNRLTLDPKVGLWSFDATLPTLQDDQGRVSQVRRFRLGKTVSVALEAGLERYTNWFTLRGWYAIDTGFSLLKSGGTVSSNRLGFDSYVNVGGRFSVFGVPMKTSILGFYVYENVSISMGKGESVDPGVQEISGLTYTAGYAGVGLALSW